MVLGCLPVTGWIKNVIGVFIVLLWGIFLIEEVQICMAMRKKAEDGLPYLIILGAQVRGTKITNSLLRRLDTALGYLEDNPDTKVIVSGGQGKGELITEAEAMASYLEQHGIPSDRIYLEAASTSTWENLKYSRQFIEDITQPVAVVTNNFHLYRALLIGKRIGYRSLQGIAASSNPVFQLNYLTREFFAVVWMKLKKQY